MREYVNQYRSHDYRTPNIFLNLNAEVWTSWQVASYVGRLPLGLGSFWIAILLGCDKSVLLDAWNWWSVNTIYLFVPPKIRYGYRFPLCHCVLRTLRWYWLMESGQTQITQCGSWSPSNLLFVSLPGSMLREIWKKRKQETLEVSMLQGWSTVRTYFIQHDQVGGVMNGQFNVEFVVFWVGSYWWHHRRTCQGCWLMC